MKLWLTEFGYVELTLCSWVQNEEDDVPAATAVIFQISCRVLQVNLPIEKYSTFYE